MSEPETVVHICESDVEELERGLDLTDLMDNGGGRRSFIELYLFQQNHTKLRMRTEQNHDRPHFHIEYKQQHAASYAIDTLERLAGCMPAKYEKPVLKWARSRQDKLNATWKALVAGEDVRELVIPKQ